MRFILFAFLILLNSLNNKSHSQIFTINESINVKSLVNEYLISSSHNGIIIKNIHYTGLNYSKALFYYHSKNNKLPPYGIILSTGNVIDVLGPNNRTASTENHLKGDRELSELYHHSKTFDAVKINFDFISLSDSISFVFQFASEEYPEYVNKGVSDIFGFFVTNTVTKEKVNLSRLSITGDPITIDLINSKTNNQYYISNSLLESQNINTVNRKDHFENYKLFQFDGFTTPIQTGLKLKPFTKYHFKIALADVGDKKFDSWVFIKGNSFISNGDKVEISEKNISDFLEFTKLDSIIFKTENDGYSIFVPVYFAYNSYELNTKSKYYLDHLKNLLYYSKNKIIVKGYTDESGHEFDNMILSENRANEVRQYFIEQGIEKDRIQALGMGEIKKGNLNIKSRKVQIKILK